jgi:isopenicillin-N epimerase
MTNGFADGGLRIASLPIVNDQIVNRKLLSSLLCITIPPHAILSSGDVMLDRRNFLVASAATAASAFALSTRAFADLLEQAPPMPDKALPDEAYFAGLRKQFLIPNDEVFLNNATNGSTPIPVLKAVMDAFHRYETMDDPNPEDYPLFGYGSFDQFREPLAKFVGVNKDEIAIVRNATEANAIMANGLDLKAGDEVLLSDQEHPSGNSPWDMRAKRYGIVIKRFANRQSRQRTC